MITIPRSDLTTDEIADALRKGLGPKYTVQPGKRPSYNPVGEPQPDSPDSITVGTGSGRIFRAEVRVDRQPDRTVLHVSPGGLSLLGRLFNRTFFSAKVNKALQTASVTR
jgi:hypothetical protein